jgi:hypothetical protein
LRETAGKLPSAFKAKSCARQELQQATEALPVGENATSFGNLEAAEFRARFFNNFNPLPGSGCKLGGRLNG